MQTLQNLIEQGLFRPTGPMLPADGSRWLTGLITDEYKKESLIQIMKDLFDAKMHTLNAWTLRLPLEGDILNTALIPDLGSVVLEDAGLALWLRHNRTRVAVNYGSGISIIIMPPPELHATLYELGGAHPIQVTDVFYVPTDKLPQELDFNGRTKLTPAQRTALVEGLKNKISPKELAETYDISVNRVYQIRKAAGIRRSKAK